VKFACHHLNREVSGFGIANDPDRPLYIDDFVVISQISNEMFTSISEDALANHYEDMAERGFEVKQFGRVWIHTHPEISANPSHIDEQTFMERFGDADWAVMAIMSKTGDSYARLKINNFVIPTEQKLDWQVDWDAFNSMHQGLPVCPDFSAWAMELDQLVERPSQLYEEDKMLRVAFTTPPEAWPEDQINQLKTLGDRYGLVTAAGFGAPLENGQH
jgi:proteasome lid subunit RPN8/RPN11